ncbi:MAG: TIGR01906 family membrane protein [Chloroflexota bacterium]|nr:TIGR01906 family membrane protein [Chloroflexota bacterium]
MPRWLTNLLMLVLIIGIPPFLILSNVFLFMAPNWLDYEYGKPDFPKAQLFDDKDRRYNAAESIEYIRGNRTLEQFKALGVYQDREIKHMVDVRNLVDKVKVIDPVLGVLLLVSVVGLTVRPTTRASAAQGLFRGGVLTILLFGAIGLFAATGFNTFFTDFHRIFFEGDSWQFLYTDSLIQFYPLPFWFDTSIALVGLTVAEAIAVGAIGWWWEKRQWSVTSSQ